MTFPALKLVRHRVPDVRIHYVTTDYARELAECCGLAHTVHLLRFERGIRNFWRYRELRRKVKAGLFDRVFIFGKPTRYVRHIGSIDRAYLSEDFAPGHKAERLARAVMKGLDLDPCPVPSPQIAVPDDSQALEKFARLGLDVPRGGYLVVHPGSRSLGQRWTRPKKIWPTDRYAALIDVLADRMPDLRVALVGTARERPKVEARLERRISNTRVLNFCGATSLSEMLHLLKHAACVVGGDSGVMHLGTAVGTPMVTLFGPTDEHTTGPFGMGDKATFIRAVPYEAAIGDPDSMSSIGVEQVVEEVARRLRPDDSKAAGPGRR